EYLADRSDMLDEFRERQRSVVRDAEIGVGDARSGHVGGGKSLIGDDTRGKRIAHAWQQQRRGGTQHLTKLARRARTCHRCFLSGLRHCRRADIMQPIAMSFGEHGRMKWYNEKRST